MQIFKIFPGKRYLSCLKSTLPKKTALEKWWRLVSSLWKNSEYAPDMKHFQKAYLRPFPGLNVFVFSSGGQVIFKKELVTVTSYFAEKVT